MLLPYNRSTRVGVLIKQIVSSNIRNIIELDNILVTIMDVVLTKDLLNCKIYYSVLSNNEIKQKVFKILNRNLKHIRYKIATSIHLRYIPSIRFIFDNTNEKANRIHNILNQVAKEQKLSNKK
ncbi:MAG: 30S ribosome-binding factor RbfA [Endomicrobium sp.]|jgi:ribosome-binding factor A|nr:30S ribosome-binding factor RbfA [Endomicrobium sp.]